jgi:hypothetical protein
VLAGEPVAFVVEDEVGDVGSVVSGGADDLVGFG